MPRLGRTYEAVEVMMFDVLTYGVRSFAFLCVGLGASLLPGKMCVRRDTRAAFQQATNAVTAALSGLRTSTSCFLLASS